MSLCGCCITEVCPVCYTGIGWNADFDSNYTSYEGQFWQDAWPRCTGEIPFGEPRRLRDFTENYQLWRIFDGDNPTDKFNQCSSCSGITRRSSCGGYTVGGFGPSENCSGDGFASNLYIQPGEPGASLRLSTSMYENAEFSGIKFPPHSISNQNGSDARIISGSVDSSLSNLTQINFMTGGPYDPNMDTDWAAYPYRHVSSGKLYTVPMYNTYRYYDSNNNPSYTGNLPYTLGNVTHNETYPLQYFWDFAFFFGEETPPDYSKGFGIDGSPADPIYWGKEFIWQDTPQKLYGAYKWEGGAVLGDNRGNRGYAIHENNLFGFWRFNPSTLLSGVFQKQYSSYACFDRFGDTSSDGGKIIYQASGRRNIANTTRCIFGTGALPTKPFEVTQFDGYSDLLSARPSTPFDFGSGLKFRQWSEHKFLPFVDISIFSEVRGNDYGLMECYYRKQYDNKNYANYSDLIRQYDVNYESSGAWGTYNDAPVYMTQSSRVPNGSRNVKNMRLPKTGIAVASDIFNNYEVQVNVMQTGLPYMSGWNGGNNLIDGPSGWFAPLQVVTSIPELNFESTGSFDMPVFRCSNGESQSILNSNHADHEVVGEYMYAVPPDNWDDVLADTGSSFYDTALLSAFTHQRGSNISGAKLEILNSLGLSTTDNNFFYARSVPFPSGYPVGASGYDTDTLYYPTGYRSSGISLFKNLYPALYGLPSDQFKQKGTYWSYASGDDWATAVDDFVESNTSIRGDEFGEFSKSKGVAASHGPFLTTGDSSTKGLILDSATWYFRDSGLSVTGTQVLKASDDYNSFTIPNGVEWIIGRQNGSGEGLVSEYDLCTLRFDNIGIQSADISGYTLDHSQGINGSGVLATGSPESGILRPFQSFDFDFLPFSGFSLDFNGLGPPKRTDMEFINNASGFLIPSEFEFSVLVYGSGGVAPPPPP